MSKKVVRPSEEIYRTVLNDFIAVKISIGKPKLATKILKRSVFPGKGTTAGKKLVASKA